MHDLSGISLQSEMGDTSAHSRTSGECGARNQHQEGVPSASANIVGTFNG
jgi:hypothetical protein